MPYFSKFQKHGEHIFRLDTRIYLHDNACPSRHDICIGAVIGKNPGSAAPTIFDKLAPLDLNGDKMLPSVRNRFADGYKRASVQIPLNAFVRVWNLFYLCDKDLKRAIRKFSAVKDPLTCSTEHTPPDIVWIAWGNEQKLVSLCERFTALPIKSAFYYEKNQESVMEGLPEGQSFAKHPQGLPGKPIEVHLSKLIGSA